METLRTGMALVNGTVVLLDFEPEVTFSVIKCYFFLGLFCCWDLTSDTFYSIDITLKVGKINTTLLKFREMGQNLIKPCTSTTGKIIRIP